MLSLIHSRVTLSILRVGIYIKVLCKEKYIFIPILKHKIDWHIVEIKNHHFKN